MAIPIVVLLNLPPTGLTGLNKAETAAKHGEEQVKIWRRSFDIPPPAMDESHPYYDIIVNDTRYVTCKMTNVNTDFNSTMPSKG